MRWMPFSFHFEIGAIVLLFLLLLVLCSKKRLSTRSNSLFRVLVCLMIGNNLLGILCGLMVMGTISGAGLWGLLINVAEELLGFITLANYMLYMLSLVYLADFHKKYVRFGMIPILLIGLVALMAQLHRQYYWKDAVGRVYQGTLYWVVGALVFSVILVVTTALMIFGKHISRKHRILISGISILIISSFLLEAMIQPVFRIIYPIFTVLLFLHYLTLQSPDFYIDHLTGLFNQKGFLEVLKENVEYRKPTWCLLIRVNNYNSLVRIFRYDHMVELRKNMANVLLDTGKRGNVYRIGSSTFALICRSEDEVARMHQILTEILPKRWEFGMEVIRLKYCYYQLSYLGDDTDFEKMAQWIHYARSDHKGHHKTGELIPLRYDTATETERKREVAHCIEDAIMDQSMEIHMQPVYSIDKEQITSLEVLSRMKDRNGEYINPEFFIHVAEENHTIVKLGELIFRRACIFAAQNHIFDLGIEYMNINISPGQCQYEHLTEDLVRIAEEYEIPVERIHLEITETEFQDPDAVERTLAMLRKAGIKVALDDFGTGCSTLLSILELPLDYVKIDKSLVWSYDAGDNRFLDDLMPIIKAEGKKVIAEGIETEEHIELFRKLKGDFLQGYYFSKPIPEHQFVNYVRDFNRIQT